MQGSRRDRGTRPAVAAAVVMALAALVSGCGGTQRAGSGAPAGSSESMVDRAGQRSVPSGPGLGQVTPDDTGSGSAAGQANRPVVQTRAVIRKGEIWLVTRQMNRVRTEIDDLLGRLGGYIDSEDSMNDRAGRPERSVLVLRVPEPGFDDAMDALRHLGRTEHADRSSEDVTTQVIDVDSRVATQEASLARLRTFLRQATNVADMIRVESEIASREAELESLQAQQKYLHDQTAMSTVTVHLRMPASGPQPGNDSGFLAGLKDGWHALAVVLLGAATVLGALLPFAVVLALVGVPVWLVLRAVSRRRHSAPAPPPAAEAG